MFCALFVGNKVYTTGLRVMEAYAIVETGGKQYRVEKGDVLDVELLEGDAGSKITLDKVIALSDGKELNTKADGSSVTAEVVEHYRGKKLIAFKKKRRKGYTRKVGHRQELTKIKILDFA